MFINRTQNEGQRTARENGHGASRNDPFAALTSLDVPATIRKYPFQALAIAGGTGALIGLTMGSRIARIVVGSVGMYTLSEALRRYAKKTIDELQSKETPAAAQPH